MLHTRIQLIKAYLLSLPPSYLNTPSTPNAPAPTQSAQNPEINHPLLRSILALLSRLPLLLSTGSLSTFKQETLAEQSDVELVSLLGGLGRSVKDARELGRKFGVVESARRMGRKGLFGAGGLGMGEGMLEGEEGGSGEGGVWIG